MSMQKPCEALLRPPFEWLTSASAWAAAFLLMRFPELFILPYSNTKQLATAFFVFGCYRLKQGHCIYRYQRNLKCMPGYTMTSKELPASNKKLFLGKGFLWTAQHTQRLRDLDLSFNLHFKYPSRIKNWARQKELHWEKKFFLKYLAKLFKINHWLNPVRPYPDIGGEPCIHGVADREEDIAINLIERASHLLVLGLPGVGKTRFAELLISQDIHRGDVVIVLDPMALT